MNARDRALRCLYDRGARTQQVHRLCLPDVVVQPDADFLECRDALRLPPAGGAGGRGLPVDAPLRQALEDYLNAAHHGRPFLDYRPDIGQHVFPSHVTGGGLSVRALRKLAAPRSNGAAPRGGSTPR